MADSHLRKLTPAYNIVYKPLICNPENSVGEEGQKALFELVDYAERLEEQVIKLQQRLEPPQPRKPVVTWLNLLNEMKERGFDEDEYYSFLKYDTRLLDQEIWSDDVNEVLCYWRPGSNEGYYASVEAVIRDKSKESGVRYENVMLGKFWDAERAEAATRVAAWLVNKRSSYMETKIGTEVWVNRDVSRSDMASLVVGTLDGPTPFRGDHGVIVENKYPYASDIVKVRFDNDLIWPCRREWLSPDVVSERG